MINVSSHAHQRGKMHFDNLQFEGNYNPLQAYFQSKLANTLFTKELQRKFEAAGSKVLSLSSHPGAAKTNLLNDNPGGLLLLLKYLRPLVDAILSQPASVGALSTLRAAVDPEVTGGDYYEPENGWKGYPTSNNSSELSKNTADAARLWEVSEQLTGVTYNFQV